MLVRTDHGAPLQGLGTCDVQPQAVISNKFPGDAGLSASPSTSFMPGSLPSACPSTAGPKRPSVEPMCTVGRSHSPDWTFSYWQNPPTLLLNSLTSHMFLEKQFSYFQPLLILLLPVSVLCPEQNFLSLSLSLLVFFSLTCSNFIQVHNIKLPPISDSSLDRFAELHSAVARRPSEHRGLALPPSPSPSPMLQSMACLETLSPSQKPDVVS